MEKCEICEGKGYIPYRNPRANPKDVYGRMPCGICKGTGEIKVEKEPRFRKVFD